MLGVAGHSPVAWRPQAAGAGEVGTVLGPVGSALAELGLECSTSSRAATFTVIDVSAIWRLGALAQLIEACRLERDVVSSVRLAVTLQCSAADKHECDVSIHQCVRQRFAPGVYVRVSHASIVARACWSEI